MDALGTGSYNKVCIVRTFSSKLQAGSGSEGGQRCETLKGRMRQTEMKDNECTRTEAQREYPTRIPSEIVDEAEEYGLTCDREWRPEWPG
jgi:hypothetical protein